MELICPRCGKSHAPAKARYLCDCGSVLLVGGPLRWAPRGRGVWRYASCLPPVAKKLAMGEGGTPLVAGRDRPVYYKLEGDNPTGSFKDRGSAVVVSKALGEGCRAVTTASTGNMGASVAAYAAYANIRARVFVPAATPENKLAQIAAYGAELHKVKGTFHDAVAAVWQDVARGNYLAMTGANPYYLEGEKTIGYEIFEEIGVPDNIIVPMGTGGLITAIYKAFRELKGMRKASRLPRMFGVQAKGCAPITEAWRSGGSQAQRIPKAETIASAIMVKTPFNDSTAIAAIRDSGGEAIEVSDAEIRHSIIELGREGIFAEPAAAAALAAYHKIGHRKGEKTVLIITGSGLKDPSAATKTRKARSRGSASPSRKVRSARGR